MTSRSNLSRRDFVKSAGGLLVGFSMADALVDVLHAQGVPQAAPAAPPPVGAPLAKIDSWIREFTDRPVEISAASHCRRKGELTGERKRDENS